MFPMNWWLLSLIMPVGTLAAVITCCTKARYSLCAEKKNHRALIELDPDCVDCDVDDPRIKVWSGVTLGHVSTALSCAVLYPISILLMWQSPCWYPLVLNGFTFISAYFVNETWKAQGQISQMKAFESKHLTSDLPTFSTRH